MIMYIPTMTIVDSKNKLIILSINFLLNLDFLSPIILGTMNLLPCGNGIFFITLFLGFAFALVFLLTINYH